MNHRLPSPIGVSRCEFAVEIGDAVGGRLWTAAAVWMVL
ncbi:hypothetical protein M2272_002283 [Mycobacterium frederiksbergense]|uniref:Uncharacterized protein n=1 Tax=Mycolicibacterium frederiksbergense TaxID=117567 RepID=A0ABT6KY57_9MYCO|nr:hypothetical protein [Mycolicibacterium frederiksbergense]